jgi:A/G-specific adenine glycosylase
VSDARSVRTRLLRWYRRNKRDLPWRRSDDPYAIWISEVMLQQTRVEVVIPYFERFLIRFPTPSTLARASEEQVLAAWGGLGYYRRARSLRTAAQIVVREHGGHLPSDVATLRTLPGIGRYTAGAIASIAFGKPEPVLDGNVKRVLCRLQGSNGPGGEGWLWELATELVRDSPDPGTVNQGLMELGATVCTPRRPACASCPVSSLCRGVDSPERWPPAQPRRPVERVRVAVALVRRGQRALLERPAEAEGNPLRGAWDLPAVELESNEDAREAILAKLGRLGLKAEVMSPRRAVVHSILYRRLTLEVCECRPRSGRVSGRSDLRWVDPDGLRSVAVSGATLKIARPSRR